MNLSGMVVPVVHEYEVLEDDELDNITVDCAVSYDGTWKIVVEVPITVWPL